MHSQFFSFAANLFCMPNAYRIVIDRLTIVTCFCFLAYNMHKHMQCNYLFLCVAYCHFLQLGCACAAIPFDLANVIVVPIMHNWVHIFMKRKLRQRRAQWF